MNAGYSGTPLAKKLGIKEGYKVLFVNQPEHYFNLFADLPEIEEAKKTDSELDFIHLFVFTHKEMDAHFKSCKSQLAKKGTLWVSWPKKASKVPTDLDGNIVREYGLANGLVDVKVCAVDKTWSGLKFMYRIKDR
ncbi:DUF3052 domain-containing protein [Fulvivirga lutea]|uniref:DUF3052 domain-containing protein n=1 Tax=Fulvivirga lutea TaxID=2810512 RepID=A0A975A290_9BACT|nr:DUF3052 domain-containing protein [Fulvivirga lutea]QSE99234.1 DUF3052 domain-containing protein [Fulvivirga lutea]